MFCCRPAPPAAATDPALVSAAARSPADEEIAPAPAYETDSMRALSADLAPGPAASADAV